MNRSIEAATILESFFLFKDLFKMYKILPLYPFPSTSWDALLIPNPFVATSGKKNSPPIRSTQLLSLGRCSHLRLNNSSKMGQIDTIFLEFWQKEIFLSFLGLRIACLYRNHPLLDLVFFFKEGETGNGTSPSYQKIKKWIENLISVMDEQEKNETYLTELFPIKRRDMFE